MKSLSMIDLKLAPKKSFLTDKVFTEVVDVRILGALLNAPELLIHNSDWNEEIMLKKVMQQVKQGKLRVKYIHSKGGIPNLGRVNAKGLVSLGSLRREIRGSLTTGAYIDIDIVNAHPNMINQLLLAFNLSNTSYASYCASREETLKRVMKHHKVSRDDAKQLFHVIGYGGSYANWIKDKNASNDPMPFVLDFRKESNALANTFIMDNSKLYAKYCKQKDFNQQLGFLSCVIQNYERAILEAMFTFFQSNTLITNNDCILCHDGIMLRTTTLPEGVLDKLALHIHETLGFNLVWKDKPMEHYLDLLTMETLDVHYAGCFDADYFKSLSTYELKKEYFEMFVCKVINPQPAYVVLDTFQDMLGEKSKAHLYREGELRTAYKQYNEDNLGSLDRFGKDTKFIDRWMLDTDLKVFDRLDFLPYNDVKRVNEADAKTYNLFTGYNSNIKAFEYSEAKRMKIIQPFLDILTALCEDSESYTDFMLNLLAQILQQPMKKLPIAIIFKGKQGTGKSLLMKALSNVFGSEHVFSSSKASDFTGEHAEGCVNKLIVNMNEANQKDTFNFEGLLKSLISEDTLRINPKFVRPFDVKNWARVFITTNKPNGVQIDFLSGDRRWMVFQSSDKFLDKKYTHQFWSKMFAHINKPEFISALYQHLNSLNIESYDFAKMRKTCLTASYHEMMKRNIPYQAQWMEDFLNEFKFGGAVDCFSEATILDAYTQQQQVRRTDMYQKYRKWMQLNRPSCVHDQSARNFYATLADLEMPLISKKSRGVQNFLLVPQQVYEHLLVRRWTEHDEEEEKVEVLMGNEATDAAHDCEFDEMFSL